MNRISNVLPLDYDANDHNDKTAPTFCVRDEELPNDSKNINHVPENKFTLFQSSSLAHCKTIYCPPKQFTDCEIRIFKTNSNSGQAIPDTIVYSHRHVLANASKFFKNLFQPGEHTAKWKEIETQTNENCTRIDLLFISYPELLVYLIQKLYRVFQDALEIHEDQEDTQEELKEVGHENSLVLDEFNELPSDDPQILVALVEYCQFLNCPLFFSRFLITILHEKIDLSNVNTYFILFHQFNIQAGMEFCIEYAALSSTRLINDSVLWNALDAKFLLQLVKSSKFAVQREFLLLRKCIDWATANYQTAAAIDDIEKHKHMINNVLVKFLPYFRYSEMSLGELVVLCNEHRLITKDEFFDLARNSVYSGIDNFLKGSSDAELALDPVVEYWIEPAKLERDQQGQLQRQPKSQDSQPPQIESNPIPPPRTYFIACDSLESTLLHHDKFQEKNQVHVGFSLYSLSSSTDDILCFIRQNYPSGIPFAFENVEIVPSGADPWYPQPIAELSKCAFISKPDLKKWLANAEKNTTPILTRRRRPRLVEEETIEAFAPSETPPYRVSFIPASMKQIHQDVASARYSEPLDHWSTRSSTRSSPAVEPRELKETVTKESEESEVQDPEYSQNSDEFSEPIRKLRLPEEPNKHHHEELKSQSPRAISVDSDSSDSSEFMTICFANEVRIIPDTLQLFISFVASTTPMPEKKEAGEVQQHQFYRGHAPPQMRCSLPASASVYPFSDSEENMVRRPPRLGSVGMRLIRRSEVNRQFQSSVSVDHALSESRQLPNYCDVHMEGGNFLTSRESIDWFPLPIVKKIPLLDLSNHKGKSQMMKITIPLYRGIHAVDRFSNPEFQFFRIRIVPYRIDKNRQSHELSVIKCIHSMKIFGSVMIAKQFTMRTEETHQQLQQLVYNHVQLTAKNEPGLQTFGC